MEWYILGDSSLFLCHQIIFHDDSFALLKVKGSATTAPHSLL
jgi:hypothetical protein